MPEEQWYALEGGQQRGPFTRAQLVTRLGEGAPVALVWREGMAGWVPPQDVAELEGWEADDPAPHAFEGAFRAVARVYGAAVHVDGTTLRFETMQADLTVRVSCDVGRRGEDATLDLERLGVPYPELTIRREGELDRGGKSLGIAREVQVDDEALDRAAYFDTALPASAVRDLVLRPGFRRPLDRWLAQDLEWVRLDEDGLAVSLRLVRPGELTPERVEAELAAVAAAADALRVLDHRSLARHRLATWPAWVGVLGLLGALVGAPGAFLAHALWEPLSSNPVLLGIAGGAALCLAIVAAMVLLLRRQSDAFRWVLFAGATLGVALPSLATAGLLVANGAFDRSADVVLETVVREKTDERVRRASSYFFGRARYRTRHYLVTIEGARVRKVPVAEEAWKRVRVGAPLGVRLRPGALGWEWNARPE